MPNTSHLVFGNSRYIDHCSFFDPDNLGNFLAVTFHFEFMKTYYWLFCIGFFGISAYNILTYFAIRSKDYIKITHTKISQSVSGSVSKIILGILSFGSFGLICGEIIGRMAGVGH